MILMRDVWNARPSVLIESMKNPVPFVIIHHSYIPGACNSMDECIIAMKMMQDLHQIKHGWNDIGYSFAVGGDGNIYEGRGWSAVGAHAPGYNNQSIGICTIGDWRESLPPQKQLDAIHKLIELGVQQGYIEPDYKLLTHRQAKDTECPGSRLFAEIQTWEHFVNKPVLWKGIQPLNGVEENKLFFFSEKS